MAVYSINDIEKLCGIKAHTIRIWEKRYNIIQPRRTKTNIRYYLDNDLQKILNISLLNRNGYKISKIAKMSEVEMKNLASELSNISIQSDDNLDTLMFAMLELDEYKFNKILDHNIESKGFEETMNQVIYPLMEKLSMMWIAGSIKSVHESFVSNAIKRKTIIAINKISIYNNPEAKKFLIYLPENESHELSLLFLHFMLKDIGFNVVNLGSQVPLIDVIDGHQISNAEFIITLFNDSFSEDPLQPYLKQLSKNIPDAMIIITGYQTAVQNIQLPKNVRLLNSIEEIKKLAKKAKAGIKL